MMPVHALDRFSGGGSLVHDLDPRVKVGLTVLYIVSNVALPDGDWPAFFAAWLLLVAGNLLAGLGPGYTLRRSFVALPFALAAVTAIFSLPGRPLGSWSLGPWEMVATDAGLVRFASIVTRSWLSVQGAILLVATTRFPDLMHALRHLHVPPIMIAIVSLMYRYLYLVGEETQRLLRARDARSARLPGARGGGRLLWRARVAGNMAGQLFLRSYERSDRVYNAMLARGFRGTFLTLNPHQMRPRDWAALALVLGLVLLLQALARI
jgi:cobalt/nickel transport system permease protein